MEQEKTSGMSVVRKPFKTFSDIVADWLTVYGKVYREEVSEELILAYQLCLNDCRRTDVLHQAFQRALKNSVDFRPTPAKVLEAYRIELENLPSPPSVLESEPTKEERELAAAEARKNPALAKILRG